MAWRTLAVGILLTAGAAASAQEPAAPVSQVVPGGIPVEGSPETGRAEDVGSVDAIVAAFYDVISGPAGSPRQWSRDRTLYVPGAKFVIVGVKEGGSEPSVAVLDHQEFVDRSDAGMVQEGFFEKEIHRITRRFGNVAHVLSTYEARRTADGPVIERGVNSLSLYFDGQRWWIANAAWDVERPGNPIPQEFLFAERSPVRPGAGARKKKAPVRKPKRR